LLCITAFGSSTAFLLVQVVFASGLVLGEGTASIINAVGKALF
jgi:uncharacterized oligopeptide transporter (OPT) family protein